MKDWKQIEHDFLEWDNETHSNASQRQILDWFRERLEKQAEEQEENQDEKPKYDKAYLNECIKKAKPNLSKIKDIDKALDEIRGVEPSKVMDNDFIEKTQNDVDRAMELAIKKSGKKKPSKGAKEWLSKNYHEFMIHWRNTGRKDSFIFNMLEQYRAEGLREELNNFLRFYLNCPESSLWKAVDEYLKQKP